jgi:PH (Pleckstrin Homology) domain-containing protein/putative oligomerization/nucleic acid binding protein
MTYADKLLADNERVVLRRRQHWMSLVRDSIRGLLLWLLAVVLLFAVPFFNLNGGLLNLTTLGAVLVFGVGLLIVAWQYALWRTEEYLVTTRRLMKVSGVVNKRSADSSLEKINDAILTQGMWGRVFNYGDLDILTAAETPVDQYRMLAGAPEFKKTMLNEKHNLEIEVASGGRPTPPLRADPAAAAAAPAAATMGAGSNEAPATMSAPAAPPAMGNPGPPPPPAPPVDASLEVTQTLARLADLRDRGAITPEEYEAKKAELLGRL